MTGGASLDVLVAGDLFLDLVMSGFESLPLPGEEAFARKFHKEVGGGAATRVHGARERRSLHQADSPSGFTAPPMVRFPRRLRTKRSWSGATSRAARSS